MNHEIAPSPTYAGCSMMSYDLYRDETERTHQTQWQWEKIIIFICFSICLASGTAREGMMVVYSFVVQFIKSLQFPFV